MYKRAIYWFKRDLRLDDNRSFFHASVRSKDIIPVFIFIPQLLERFNAYDRRLSFIVECIKDLHEKLSEKGSKLYCFYDDPINVFRYLIAKYKIEAIFTSKAFSYGGEKLDKEIGNLCSEINVDFIKIKDNFLSDIERIPYRKVYSHFYLHWKKTLDIEIAPTLERINTPHLGEPGIKEIQARLRYEENNYWKPFYVFERLNKFDFSRYDYTRDRLDIDGTSKLSPFIRFGNVSIRKIYKKVIDMAGEECQFIKELAWREFWYHIKINFPDFKSIEFQEKRRGIKWENNHEFIKSFKQAKTGYPIIDASIRQLLEEKWMHNRARMIVASFLTKDLLIDWRIGERFFMEHLLDYDEVINIGNWQWNASVGPDPRPLRIFNPIIQAKKFDPDALFIKKYLPELKNIPSFMLHDPLNYKIPYHRPVVDHFKRAILVKKVYRK